MTTGAEPARRMGVLYREHVLLGAEFAADEQTGVLGVRSYANEASPGHVREGAALLDLTGSCYLLVSGADAQAFAETALCGRRLAVGEVAWEACLTGDGALVSVPLVVRTGDSEYVIADSSERRQTLFSWLGFLAKIEQKGTRAFGNASVEDAHEMLVPLMLIGAQARSVLSDYVRVASELPRTGTVKSVRLDAISTVVARADAPYDCYLVLAPPPSARPLWRSFLSFDAVAPMGTRAAHELVRGLPWGSLLGSSDAIRATREQLFGWGLMREGDDFVGARGIAR